MLPRQRGLDRGAFYSKVLRNQTVAVSHQASRWHTEMQKRSAGGEWERGRPARSRSVPGPSVTSLLNATAATATHRAEAKLSTQERRWLTAENKHFSPINIQTGPLKRHSSEGTEYDMLHLVDTLPAVGRNVCLYPCEVSHLRVIKKNSKCTNDYEDLLLNKCRAFHNM